MARRVISYAVLQEHHQQKRHNPHTPPLDLSECDLSGFDLHNLDLSGTNLSKADLTGAILGNTNLSQTLLSHTRFADIRLGALLEAGIEPASLLEQHRDATYYLLRIFHFSTTPEPARTFALSNEDCARICQIHAELLWQNLDDQAVIQALYPGFTWEDWMVHMANRSALDWVMTNQKRVYLLREANAKRWFSPAELTRILDATSDPEALFGESLLARIRQAIHVREKRELQHQQYEREEALWLAEQVAYPPAPWQDGPSVRQIRSRQELVAILKAPSRSHVSRYDVLRYENGCLGGHSFLYHVGEPVSKGPIAQILPDGNVWSITDQESDLSPLATWLKAQGAFYSDFSSLGRACNLLSQAGIAKLVYQIYWYCDEDQVDVQSCLDEHGNELPTDTSAISRAHWLLHYEQGGARYYGQYELVVAEKRLTRLGDAQVPEVDEDDEDIFNGGAE